MTRLAKTSIRLADGRELVYYDEYLAASESVMGVWINDVGPERAAAMLRGAAQPSA